VGVPRPVIHEIPPGHALLGPGEIHPDDAPRPGIGARHRQFQGVQGPPGVPSGHGGQVAQCLLGNLGLDTPQTPFLIQQGPIQDGADVRRGQGSKIKILARDKSGPMISK